MFLPKVKKLIGGEKKKKMNTIKKIAIALAVLMVVALAAPATADYSGDRSLTTYEHQVLEDGGLVYATVEDGSAYTLLQAMPEYPGTSLPNLTQSLTVVIPEGATVKMARLYNYYTWSASDYGDGSNPGMPAEADISFEGVKKVCQHGLPDGLANRDSLANPIDYGNGVIQYWDTKGQGYDPAIVGSYAKKYDNPSGTFAWDVTDMVTGSGTYTAKIQNADSTPTAGLPGKPYKYWERFATFGFGLLVVYEEDKPGAEMVEYWVTEGCDMLYPKKYETPEQATTRATFDGKELKGKKKADLITVVTASDKGKDYKNMIYYNLKEVGPSTACSNKAIGVNYFDVKIEMGSNIAEFQDRNDYDAVRNAFLINRYGKK